MKHNYRFDNVNTALPRLMNELLHRGDEFGSRAGLTKELMHVGITLERPWQREIVLPDRKASVAAQIVETMWVLSGRNDVEGLSHYLPRAADFSDDGQTWRAGYGPRLRNYEGTDQLAYIVDTMTRSPGSRQAVASIWDPVVDTAPGKDIACLAGETLLRSPEGDLPIEQVAAKFASGGVDRWPVYAVDPGTRQQRITWASNVWQSGVKPTIRLTFDDGSDLRLTHDHRLYIKRRVSSGKKYGTTWEVSEIEAGDLMPGDRVLATGRHKDRFKRNLDQNTSWDNMVPIHREYAALLGYDVDGMDVHHKNHDHFDNRAENLEVLSAAAHSALHRAGDGNPMRRMSPEDRAAKGQRHAAALTGRKHSEETRRKMSESAKKRSRKDDGTYAPDNHVVVAVEDGGVVPVFDFTVPGEHTALVGTGVVAHNCNNWLSFSSRFGHLDLHVGIRSNDAIWGWSGINAFEWSALQELVAGLAGLMVGSLHFSVTSFHLYEHHWQKARRLTQDDTGFVHEDSPRFDRKGCPSLHRFDELAVWWFDLERAIRHGRATYDEVEAFPEPMLRSWLRVLEWYWSGDQRYLDPLADTRLREACKVSVKPAGEPQAEQLEAAGTGPASAPREAPDLLPYLNRLHAEKHAAYGDSWKRRGEAGILSNIARKVDRIGTGADTSDETQADTAIDLTVYLAKYRLWLDDLEATPDEVAALLADLPNHDYPVSSEFDDDLDDLYGLPVGKSDAKERLVDLMLAQALAYARSVWA